MKKYKISFVFILLLLILSKCTLEQNSNKNITSEIIKYQKTIAGGCNNDNNVKSYNEDKDTIVFGINNDTLDIFVGKNYICCALFASETKISNDSIILFIKDTCKDNSICYCKCNCYYTWNFIFTNFEKRKYCYKILLYDGLQDSVITFREGIFEINK
jgi:hypothetical protein